jgi:hypothetical protein
MRCDLHTLYTLHLKVSFNNERDESGSRKVTGQSTKGLP